MISRFTIWLAALLLPVLMCSCWVTKQVKQVRWHDYTFHLAVSDGGATTNFSWTVVARYNGLFGMREKELFRAYGGPYLTDMQIEGNRLVLLTSYEKQPARIELDLQHVEALLDAPIAYRRFELKQSNAFYQEPAFIKAQRKIEEQFNLEADQRRQQREAARN